MCVGYFMSCSAGWRRWLMATKKSSGRSNCRAYAAAGVLSTNATRAARRDNPSKGGDNERGDDTLRHMNPRHYNCNFFLPHRATEPACQAPQSPGPIFLYSARQGYRKQGRFATLSPPRPPRAPVARANQQQLGDPGQTNNPSRLTTAACSWRATFFSGHGSTNDGTGAAHAFSGEHRQLPSPGAPR